MKSKNLRNWISVADLAWVGVAMAVAYLLRYGWAWDGPPGSVGGDFHAPGTGSRPGMEPVILASSVGWIPRRLAVFSRGVSQLLSAVVALDDVVAGRRLPCAPVCISPDARLFWRAVVCRFRIYPFCGMVGLPFPVSQRVGAPGGHCRKRISGPGNGGKDRASSREFVPCGGIPVSCGNCF